MAILRKKAPPPFIKSCNLFIDIDNFNKPVQKESKKSSSQNSKELKTGAAIPKKYSQDQLCKDSKLLGSIEKVISEIKEADGFAEASRIGLKLNQPPFSLQPTNYGYSKWLTLIRATERFEEGKNSKGKVAFRNKK